MIQIRRAFLERYAAQWAARADDRRRSGTAPDLLVADTLDRIVAGMRAELPTLPADPPPIGRDDDVTWRSPVFNVGGRFNPFAGTWRERMLASAEVCERLGVPDAARAYRVRAASADAGVPACPPPCLAPAPTKRRPRTGLWTGPAMAPLEPAPFVAGPQMGLFA